MTRRGLVIWLLSLSMLGLTSCSGKPQPSGTPGAAIRVLRADLVPPVLLDLTVRAEDIGSSVTGLERTYVAEAGWFSLRRADEVQATLEVLRLDATAAVDRESFRRSIVGQIAGGAPRIHRIGSQLTYAGGGARQNLFVSFKGRHLIVLSVRSDYEQPRRLLRQVLDLDL